MTNNPSIEQRICIAGNYEAEKIALIRELMEEEALAFLRFATGFPKGAPTATQITLYHTSYQQTK